MQETPVDSRGSRISSGVGNGNLFQYSCLENLMGRGAWQATVQGVVKSRTQLSILHMVWYWYLSKNCVFHSVLSMVALLYHVINGKQMPRECKWLTQGHTAVKWQRRNLSSHLPSLSICVSSCFILMVSPTILRTISEAQDSDPFLPFEHLSNSDNTGHCSVWSTHYMFDAVLVIYLATSHNPHSHPMW